MGAMASQITSLIIVYSTVYSGTDQRNHQSPASLAFVSGIHRWPVNSPHKWPVKRKMFPFDDVIMLSHKMLPAPFLLVFLDHWFAKEPQYGTHYGYHFSHGFIFCLWRGWMITSRLNCGMQSPIHTVPSTAVYLNRRWSSGAEKWLHPT